MKWRIINETLNNSKPSTNINQIKINNIILEDKIDITNALNNNFISTVETLQYNLTCNNNDNDNNICDNNFNSKKINNNNNFHTNDDNPHVPKLNNFIIHSKPVTDTLFLEETNPLEILSIVHNCKPNRSTSNDNLNVFVVKLFINEIIDPLNHIFNLSLASGIFPNDFKTAKVIPVFKKGDRENVNNYGPISLLSPFSKILEKIIYSRMKSYLSKYKILNEKQYGFRSLHSTELAILELNQRILYNMNDKKLSLGIFLDLSKAFDLINHNLLLKKLDFYGFRGTINNWLSSYLKNRFQYVCLDQHRSNILPNNYGVPQGSILGPLLFLIFINDLPEVSSLFNCIIYADDTNLFYASNNLINDQDVINNELTKFQSWFSNNKLLINYSKCSYTIMGPKILTNIFPDINITMNNIKINRLDSIKFIGLTLQSNLSWSSHIINITDKINGFLGVLNKLKTKFTKKTLITLYNSFILPYLNYGNIIWGNSPAFILNCIEKCQKRFIRIFYNLKPTDHTGNLFASLKILTIKQIFIQTSANFVFKFLHNLLPPYFNSFFKFSNSIQKRQTRNQNVFYIYPTRLKLIQTSIIYMGPKIWNETIPPTLKNITSLFIFKRDLKKFIYNYKPP